ncbi:MULTISPECIES: lysylphosphatidylglycerol synthase domain-containing protein [Prochlorococcus]|uniref:lysylphosphatidylglycerol synthase domain-containing protein n=1 Tax=Prochlorococcus TaxID=1218 RepID=UPI000533A327|nr:MULTISPECIES: lysylphosphatidylglycerol synthase domain-containing protein [Prochlorococcus]KGG12904.1 putative transmembrane protein HieC [Prochlorococcus sp. MIT 0601]
MIDKFRKVIHICRELFKKVYLPGGLKIWITFFSFLFIGYSIYSNFGKLSQQSIPKSSFLFLIFGFFVSFLSLIVNAYAWKRIVIWLGYKSKDINFISLFLTTNILKYLPGGIWHFLERFRTLKKYMSLETAFYSVILEPLFMIIAALFWVPFNRLHFLTMIICFFPLLLLTRKFRRPVISSLKSLKISDFKKIDEEISFSQSSNLSVIQHSNYPYIAILAELAFILLRFGGFWFCLYAFSIQDSLTTFSWLSAFSLSWIIGLAVPSAPGGVGIFEASILLLVKGGAPEISLISVLLCYRLIASLADLFAALVGSNIRFFSRFSRISREN